VEDGEPAVAEEANEEEEVRGEGTKVSGEFNTNSFAVGSSLKFFIACSFSAFAGSGTETGGASSVSSSSFFSPSLSSPAVDCRETGCSSSEPPSPAGPAPSFVSAKEGATDAWDNSETLSLLTSGGFPSLRLSTASSVDTTMSDEFVSLLPGNWEEVGGAGGVVSESAGLFVWGEGGTRGEGDGDEVSGARDGGVEVGVALVLCEEVRVWLPFSLTTRPEPSEFTWDLSGSLNTELHLSSSDPRSSIPRLEYIFLDSISLASWMASISLSLYPSPSLASGVVYCGNSSSYVDETLNLFLFTANISSTLHPSPSDPPGTSRLTPSPLKSVKGCHDNDNNIHYLTSSKWKYYLREYPSYLTIIIGSHTYSIIPGVLWTVDHLYDHLFHRQFWRCLIAGSSLF
jgi:hypothetical protein